MIKEELRLKMRAERRNLTDKAAEEMSGTIRESILSLPCVKNASSVCVFISAFKEPDTIEIIKKLLEMNKKVIAPISDTETNTLSLSYIDNIDDLRNGAYGILEPAVFKNADNDKIEVILVPGLAFDRNGGRMGFGKGYYDRLLEKTDAVKIGLCYDFQLFESIATEAHDIPMDYIITEKELVKVR